LSVACVIVVRYRSLRRADHSFRGVLSTVAHRCMLSRNLVDEEAIACAGLQSRRKKITYTESEFVALVIQHAMRMRHIVICGLSGCTFSTILFHIIQ
jgi:hypothetical protein